MMITILTIFPDYFKSAFDSSILSRAHKSGLVQLNIVDLRSYSQDKHSLTDDRPYGGGPGMVMLIEPIDLALKDLKSKFPNKKTRVVLTSAKGKKFDQKLANDYSKLDHLIIICGHYEGVDERVAQHLIDDEVRIGEFVLTGGEPAALVMTDAVTRLIPGTLGNEQSTVGESHSSPGVSGIPQYSKPRSYLGWEVPEVLLSGNHQEIEKWREEQRNKISI